VLSAIAMAPTTSVCYQIRVVYPNGRRLELESRRRLLYVGRTQGNDLRLAHPFVSARHLVLRVVGEEFRITDLGSTTGTRVGGTLLVPLVEQAVRDGELIELGPLKLTIDRILEAHIVRDEPKADAAPAQHKRLRRGWESQAGTFPRLEGVALASPHDADPDSDPDEALAWLRPPAASAGRPPSTPRAWRTHGALLVASLLALTVLAALLAILIS
jgi:predicted component of type VI protein secretion system